jgi:hypothetical protein
VVIARDFSGKMNLDSHRSKVGPADYIDALNITRNADGNEDIIANIIGNRQVSFTLPSGTNKCIGAAEDALRNRIIAVIYNSGGFHTIVKFDKDTRAITKIVQSKTDTGGTDIFGFTLDEPVRKIAVLHREEDEGDLLFIQAANVRPIGFNMDTIGDYAPSITDELIRVAKKPPTDSPAVSYGSNNTVNSNNLRKKLFQFKYRWVYEDGYKSTWSPISKVALPVGGYSVVTDTDPTENNYIAVQVRGGGPGYKKIEIAGRECIGTTYSDFFLIDTLDRTDYSIEPDGTFDYGFYNDGAYATLNLDESELYFDRVPDLANDLVLVNGNTLVYLGITEGYDPIPRSEVNVQVSYQLADTSPNPVPSLPPSLGWDISGSPSGSFPTDYSFILRVGPNVSGGSVYHVEFVTVPVNTNVFTLNVEVVADNNDTLASIVGKLIDAIDADLGANFDIQQTDTNEITITTHVSPSVGPQYYEAVNVFARGVASGQGSEASWKWNGRYQLGIQYHDEYGKTNGVVTFREITGDPNNFSVTMPNFSVNTSNSNAPRIPYATATLAHQPPSWAKTFRWVRTKNLACEKFIQYITCKVDEDDDYIYFCIENLDKYREDNTGFLPSYVFTKGDRIRLLDTVTNDSNGGVYTESYQTADYEILGEVTREVIPAAGEVEAVEGRFLKVARPSGIDYNAYMLVEIYTPALRTTEESTVFYEFGECYDIYTGGDGVRYHSGNVANQTATEAARYEFYDGDVYFKFRNIYRETLVADIAMLELGMMDANYSDTWTSSVNSNGWPTVIEPDTKRIYNPVLVRFGQSYQQGTDINGLNRFYPLNYDEYERSFGDIQKAIVWNNDMIVFQKLKIGRVPVLQAIIKYANGQESTIVSDKLINKIQYYLGQYGVGDAWESVAYNNSAIYGWDNYRAVQWRLAQNGLEALSIVYKANAFAITNAVPGRRIVGVFDAANSYYISSFEQKGSRAAKTIVFDESNKGYRCFLSYIPEWIVCLNNMLVSWKSGRLYTHDSTTYNNFYGVQYDSYVTISANDNPVMKKEYMRMSYVGSRGLDVPEIQTNTYSHGTTHQLTDLAAAEFREEESEFHAEIKRDRNSDKGKSGGDFMKGQWASFKFRFASASSFVFLLAVTIGVNSSPKQPS